MENLQVVFKNDTHGMLSNEKIEELRSGLRGEVLTADDSSYDSVRAVWNAMHDKRPALIVRCRGVADVVDAVNFAYKHDLLVSVRGGGHNVSGKAVCDGGIMIDLSLMKGIHVDRQARTVRAQGGTLLGELDREAQLFGLAAPAGVVSTTGIAGLTLGGGFGWLMRKHGLSIDNLLSVEVVTADGQVVTASESENEDLFWGIRGGGGNFGIVTSFEYRLHPVGPTVMAGFILYPIEQVKAFLHFYREFAANAPDEVMTLLLIRLAPALPFVPEALHGAPVVGAAVCHCGSLEDGERDLRPLKGFGTPVLDLIEPKPFTEHQTMFDAGAPHGLNYYVKSEFQSGLDDEAIDVIAKYGANVTSPLSLTVFWQLGGAVNRVSPDAMAFNHRDAAFMMVIQAAWEDPSEADKHISWTREFWQAMKPVSTGGVNVNFLSDDDGDRVQAAYAEAQHQRLVALKNKYDPTNLFQLNQNIKPTV